MFWPDLLTQQISNHRTFSHEIAISQIKAFAAKDKVVIVNRTSVSQEGGMLATHRHESILGGSRVEQMLSNAAERRASGQQQAVAPGLSSARRIAASDGTRCRLNVVALLATWKHVSIEQMAQTLLGMTAAERTQLRNKYTGQ